MKTNQRIIILAILLLQICSLHTVALCETVSQGDIKATISSDKESYAIPEEVCISLHLQNDSGFPIQNINIQHVAPAGFSFKDITDAEVSIPLLATGSSKEIKTIYVYQTVPQTGDYSNNVLWISIALISGATLAFFIAKNKKILCIFICVFILASLFPGHLISDAQAEDNSGTTKLEVSKRITYEGKPAVFSSTILFSYVDENDNLTDDIIDRGDIEVLIERGTIEVLFGDNGRIISIDGPVTSKIIRSAQDAADFLNSASSLFGTNFHAKTSQIRSQKNNTGDTFFQYTPEVNELGVLGSEIIISTDNTGTVEGVVSTYDNNINFVDTNVSLPKAEAEKKPRIL